MSKKWGIEVNEEKIAEATRAIELLKGFKIGNNYKLTCGSKFTPDITVVVEIRDMHAHQVNVNVLGSSKAGALPGSQRRNKKRGTYSAQIPLDQVKVVEDLDTNDGPLFINFEFISTYLKELCFNKE